MPRYQQKPHTGRHVQTMPDGTSVRTRPGDVIELPSAAALGCARYKFIALDGDGQSTPIVMRAPLVIERSGRYFYVVNPANGRRLTEKGLSREEAYELAGLPMPSEENEANVELPGAGEQGQPGTT